MERDDRAMIRVRKAYERGRWLRAARSAWGCFAIGIASLLLYSAPSVQLWLLWCVASGTFVWGAWKHDDFLDGARLGVWLGVAQLVAASFMLTCGMRWFPNSCALMCFGIVGVGSVLVGTRYAQGTAESPLPRVARMGGALVLVGLPLMWVGCAPGQAGLVWGAAIGVLLGFAPSWMWRRVTTPAQ